MRKIASIFLLLVLLFNLVGYRAWFFYAEKQSDFNLEARLDKQAYDENELISLTIPLHNPYQLEKNRFERINGEVNVGGKTFKYVSRKIVDGNMILLCIPDEQKSVLKKAQSELSGSTDLTGCSGKSKNNIKLSASSDYTNYLHDYYMAVFFHHSIIAAGNNSQSLSDPVLSTPGQPPERLS